ncbi:MAG TPA: hypothetical protein VF756_05250 [Thermoanaerobaculia bacterium]
MHRRTVHRGIAAMMLTAALALAGATPAAATELDVFERSLRWLTSLWGAGQEQESTERPGSGWSLGGILSLWGADTADKDKGMGLDPNGAPGPTSEPPPIEGL